MKNAMAQTMETDLLRFTSRAAAEEWLRDTSNCGVVHMTWRNDFIIVQFDANGAWAFSAADRLDHLPKW
jgi:hypothetical protein